MSLNCTNARSLKGSPVPPQALQPPHHDHDQSSRVHVFSIRLVGRFDGCGDPREAGLVESPKACGVVKNKTTKKNHTHTTTFKWCNGPCVCEYTRIWVINVRHEKITHMHVLSPRPWFSLELWRRCRCLAINSVVAGTGHLACCVCC